MSTARKSKTLKEYLTRKSKGVSTIVATLVLIVIAIVGAVTVGLIMSRVGASTSSAANVGNVSSNAATQLFIGGSTTIYPITQAAAPAFEAQYGVTLVDAQGGSGAGMQGVISGALDLGAASSSSAVYQAVTYITDESITGVTLNPTLIGGSGVVVIMNGLGAGGFLEDATPNVCHAVTQAALKAIYNPLGTDTTGYFTINAGACATGVLDAGGLTLGVAASTPGAIQAVSRSDLPSGTEDTFSSYIGTGSSAPSAGFFGLQVVGNPGVMAQVQKAPGTTNPGGSIGFADLGFAEGAATGVTCSTPSGEACGVAVAQVTSSAAITPAACTSAGAFNCYAASGTTTGSLHSYIKAALLNYATINPLTQANPTFASGQTEYPDSGGSLARSFYYVSNGPLTTLEQEWISYITSPSATVQAYFHNNGYFTVYDFTGA